MEDEKILSDLGLALFSSSKCAKRLYIGGEEHHYHHVHFHAANEKIFPQQLFFKFKLCRFEIVILVCPKDNNL